MAKDPLVVKRYPNEKKYQKDAKKMSKRGYEVFDVKTENQGRGCLRWGLFGVFAFALKPKHEYVVTYKLVDSITA